MDTEEMQKKAKKRINITKGQLEGLYKMIEAGVYCTDLLDQSLAIQNSLKSLDALIFEHHLSVHVSKQFQEDKEKAVEELVEVFRRKHRND